MKLHQLACPAVAAFLHSAFAATQLLPIAPLPTVQTLPPALHEGSSTALFTSGAEGLDGPKVTDVNATAYDWWYFDVVGEDAASSIAVVFYNRGPRGFIGVVDADTAVNVQVSGTYPNGTLFDTWLSADAGAVVATAGQGSSGAYLPPSNVTWAGRSDASEYVITLDNDVYKGTISFRSIAPPHYPCSAVRDNVTMEVMDGVGWSNAVPAAHASVDVAINGTRLQFEGLGYHDKNWGVTPLTERVHSWYWGHATMGPYVVVWLDGLDFAGTEYKSGYVARDGEIVYAGCGNMEVRPFGATHPPAAGELETWEPRGFTVAVDLGPELGGVLRAEVTVAGRTSRGGPIYARWAGTARGSVGGGGGEEAAAGNLTGVAGFEMFNFAPRA